MEIENTRSIMKGKTVTIDTNANSEKRAVPKAPNGRPTEAVTSSARRCASCGLTSVNFIASFTVLLIATVSFIVSMATKNWSASGASMKMGLWDFCVKRVDSAAWECFPVNTDFSVATQAFSILAAMCYACLFVLYFLCVVFPALHKARPLVIAMCLAAFATVSLQIMTLVVYATKNRELYSKIEKNYFPGVGLEELYLSWSYYFAIISTLMSTVTGALLFVEFKNLTFKSLYDLPVEQKSQN
ncbi:uncharacterized protein LOC128212803 [Mya arenaria]|uniref:uncharacterized protein LOC128212803 n=1 Tax=Mya arenaria TaxID=6604 RepID=UPI0022E65B3D|nr:uncharacterized protein LOC128212803 [Mya arenaria]